jgi:hypothetical protein
MVRFSNDCRRMFANVYGGSDLKYNKKFDPKPEDLNQNKTSENINEEPAQDDIEDIANDIHKKFHNTCDVLKKIKKKTTTSQLVSLLSKSKIELDEGFASRNKTSMDYERQIILDIGNWKCMPMIEAEEYRNFDFKKYSFRLSTSKDFAGLMLSFDYTDKKKRIQLVDFNKAFKLAIGFLPMPFGYYIISRLIVSGCALYFAVQVLFKQQDNFKPWIFGFLVVLYNPIIPMPLGSKELWMIVNIPTIYYFLYQ